MTDLPTGYRWANMYETETGWHEDKQLLVTITEYSDGSPADPDTVDIALPTSVPVLVDCDEYGTRLRCTDVSDAHDEHDDTCLERYEAQFTESAESFVDEYDHVKE